MFAAGTKIIKPKNKLPDEFETSISQALMELESNSDLKMHLRELYITSAKEFTLANGRKAVVVFVPVPQLRQFQKIQIRLVRELEKKFSGKHVLFVAQRRILKDPDASKMYKSTHMQKRPYSRTVKAVHDNMLEDIVFPAEIVGKRIRHKIDKSKIIKIHLDKAQQNNVEHKTETFAEVYKNLTGKKIQFEFPVVL